jgi:hypothetical protein
VSNVFPSFAQRSRVPKKNSSLLQTSAANIAKVNKSHPENFKFHFMISS